MVLKEAESVLRSLKLTEIPFWACRIQNKIVCFLSTNASLYHTMDSYPEDAYNDTLGGLSYDDQTTYEEQVAQIPLEMRPVVDAGEVAFALGGGLASRISTNKAYLAPVSVARVKVRLVSG